MAIKSSPEKKNLKFSKVPEGKTVGRDYSKYCEFHRAKGHHTDDCKALAEEVHSLIKAGKFSQFVKGITKKDEPQADQETKSAEGDGYREIIVEGGGDYEPTTKKARRS